MPGVLPHLQNLKVPCFLIMLPCTQSYAQSSECDLQSMWIIEKFMTGWHRKRAAVRGGHRSTTSFKGKWEKIPNPCKLFPYLLVFLASLEHMVIPASIWLSRVDQSQRRLSNREANTGTIVFSYGKEMVWWLFHFGLQSWLVGMWAVTTEGKAQIMISVRTLLVVDIFGLIFPKEI